MPAELRTHSVRGFKKTRGTPAAIARVIDRPKVETIRIQAIISQSQLADRVGQGPHHREAQ